MRKKYLLILFVTFLSIFCFINPISAKKTYCTYKSSDKDITVKFRITFDSKTKIIAETAKMTGEDVDKHLWFKSNSEGIKNWQAKFKKVNFTGQDYYASNDKCPPYLLVSLSNTGYNLFVVNDTYMDKLKDAIKDKYSTLKDGYPLVLNNIYQEPEEESDEPSSCLEFNKEPNPKAEKGSAEYYSCESNPYFACIWNEKDGYCNVDNLQYVMCGDAHDIPRQAPELISFAVNFLKIITPIILIVTSMITLLKALAASKEDEIKKAKSSLIRKIIASVLVFFVISIVQFVILKVADEGEAENISSCMSCFLNNDCSKNIYYKTNVSGIDICTNLDGDDVPCE